MRLIDANFTIYAAEGEFSEEDASKVRWLISHIPTVDAEPVRHGHWIERDGIFKDDVIKVDHLECSECGKTQRRYRDTPYCPNCGAKMD